MHQLTTQQRTRLLERHRNELNAWRYALETPILDWKITQPNQQSIGLKLGKAWGFTDGTNGYNTHQQGTVRFETTLEIPAHFAGFAVELELDLGGEGFVTIINASQTIIRQGGLNPFHRAFKLLQKAVGGEVFSVVIQAVPKGLFGSRNENPSLSRAHLVAPHQEVREFVTDLDLLIQTCKTLEPHDVVPQLLAAAELSLHAMPWTSETSDYHARIHHGSVGNPFENSILWSLPEMTALKPLEPEFLTALKEARAKLLTNLERIKIQFPSVGKLALTGHAHIDLGWLWPIAETRRKIKRTFATVLELMREYQDFKFNQSSAQVYAWLEEDAPELFQEVKARILEGRIELVGGMWVEPDGQMLNGESWVRQLLYGQDYFLEKFGQTASVAWLPDTFGFTPALPQLLESAGINNFFTTKLNWNETSVFPYDLFLWEGLDGSKVLAHCFWNPSDSYNAVINPKSLIDTWQNFKGKHFKVWLEQHKIPKSLLAFGYGDGGGGPSREHLEAYARLQNYPVLPKLEMSRVDDFYAALPRTNLPVWKGELYLELHRGTLTTQAGIKKLHRAAEHRLQEAEALASLVWLRTKTYPEVFTNLWKTLLLHQFHDILPGSSIREVYADAIPELTRVIATASNIRDKAMQVLGVKMPNFEDIETQATQHSDGRITLSNSILDVTIGVNGNIERLFDLALKREVFTASGNQITISHDLPREWEAWDVNPPEASAPEQILALEPPVLQGQTVQVKRFWRNSSMTQTYCLTGRKLEIRTRLNWQERRSILRAVFPVNVYSHTATFETAFGVISRTTHNNSGIDAAQFEVCGQRFVDLSEANYGVSLLNDSKYGHCVKNNEISLTLMRGSMYPDPTSDLGEHEFAYAIYAHPDDWRKANTLNEAARFNSPLMGNWLPVPLEKLIQDSGLDLAFSSLKKAENDNALILRIYEPNGARGFTTLKIKNLIRAARVSILELNPVNLEITASGITFEVKPFEVMTLKLWF